MDDLSTRLQDGSESSVREGPRQLAIPLDDITPDTLVLSEAPARPTAKPAANAPKGPLAGPVVDSAPLVPPPPASRALVLADFNPPEISAGERLIRLAYRLGIPGSTLATPFRKPLRPRLLATVESPVAGDRVSVTSPTPADLAALVSQLPGSSDVTVTGDEVGARVADGPAAVAEVLRAAFEKGLTARAAQTFRPTLDDVFLSLTGRSLREENAK